MSATTPAMWPAYAAAIGRHLGARLSGPEAEALAGLLDRLLDPPGLAPGREGR